MTNKSASIKRWRRSLRLDSILGRPRYPSLSNLSKHSLMMVNRISPYGITLTGSVVLELYGLLRNRSAHDIDCYTTPENMDRIQKGFGLAKSAFELNYNMQRVERITMDSFNIDIMHGIAPDIIYSHKLQHTSYKLVLEKKLSMLEIDSHIFTDSKHFTDLKSIFG